MTQQSNRDELHCKTCAAYVARFGGNGMCCRRAPTPILVGVTQRPSIGMQGVRAAEPVVQGYFPPVAETCWCAEWRRKPDGVETIALPAAISLPGSDAA